MQSLTLNENDFKKLNMIVFKFIWNRHYLASKPPERIKRDIVFKPIKLGGLGMLNVSELDSSLKLRALGQLLETRHPFLQLIHNKIDLSCFFSPICRTAVDSLTTRAIELLTNDHMKLWTNVELENNKSLLSVIRQTNIKQVLSPTGRNSLHFFMLWRRNVQKIEDLDRLSFIQISRYIKPVFRTRIAQAVATRIGHINLGNKLYFNKKFADLTKLSSWEIRMSRSGSAPLTNFNFNDLTLSVGESLNLFLKISKLSSVSHKNNLLRVFHGEIYTKERLHRFGMADIPTCPRCDEVETLTHKFYECEYPKCIWKKAFDIMNKPMSNNSAKDIFAISSSSITQLTLHAELIQRIQFLKDDRPYLIHPNELVKITLKDLAKKEGNQSLKREIKDLL